MKTTIRSITLCTGVIVIVLTAAMAQAASAPAPSSISAWSKFLCVNETYTLVVDGQRRQTITLPCEVQPDSDAVVFFDIDDKPLAVLASTSPSEASGRVTPSIGRGGLRQEIPLSTQRQWSLDWSQRLGVDRRLEAERNLNAQRQLNRWQSGGLNARDQMRREAGGAMSFRHGAGGRATLLQLYQRWSQAALGRYFNNRDRADAYDAAAKGTKDAAQAQEYRDAAQKHRDKAKVAKGEYDDYLERIEEEKNNEDDDGTSTVNPDYVDDRYFAGGNPPKIAGVVTLAGGGVVNRHTGKVIIAVAAETMTLDAYLAILADRTVDGGRHAAGKVVNPGANEDDERTDSSGPNITHFEYFLLFRNPADPVDGGTSFQPTGAVSSAGIEFQLNAQAARAIGAR